MLKRREEGEVATGRRKELEGITLEETSLLRAREEAIDGLMLNLGSEYLCCYILLASEFILLKREGGSVDFIGMVEGARKKARERSSVIG